MDFHRKRKTIDPCPVCYLHRDRCICHLIPRLELKTRLALVVHHRELKRTTNTGRLAVRSLVNSEMHVRGESRSRLDLSSLLTEEYETYILYPSEDAVDLESLRPTKPVQLIVSDGNWRQAGKLHRRHTELQNIPRVRIRKKNLSGHDPSQNLRVEHFADGYSTLEAIAIALGVLEGESVREALSALYQAKLQATLEGRGVAFGTRNAIGQ